MQSENGISNWNLKIQKNPKITKSREKNPKFFFHPKYGLWGLKSKGIARAFISSEKISRFLAILAFWYRGRYFFLTFWQLIIYVKVIFLGENPIFLIEISIFPSIFLKFQVQYIPRFPKTSLDSPKTWKSIDFRPFKVKNLFQNTSIRAFTAQ